MCLECESFHRDVNSFYAPVVAQALLNLAIEYPETLDPHTADDLISNATYINYLYDTFVAGEL